MPLNAYPADLWNSSANFWDKNIAEQYIIAYEFNSGLSHTIQDMLPQVSFEKAVCLCGLLECRTNDELRL